jgi:TetR/AcrR family transcriptional regulator, transcriptional repressor for nem operon
MGRTSDAKARLIEAAMELIYARGYSAVGVQEICAQAGVNKGSFYHFFPSKQALVLTVIDAYAQYVQQMWEEAMLAVPSPLERMLRVFEIAYEAHRTLVDACGQMRGCPIGNLVLELSNQDETIRQKLWEVCRGWADMVERMLREAAASGELHVRDIDTTAQSVIAYFEGVLLLAKAQNDPLVVKQLAQGVKYLLETHRRDHLDKSQ